MKNAIWSVLAFSLLLASALTARADGLRQDHTLVGAIRWDAWTGLPTGPGSIVNETLGPLEYHFRLPFFARETGPNSVMVNEASQEIIDREIEYAHRAGLDYWAFDYYPENTGLDYGRRLYLSSKLKSRINYCLILNVNPNPDAATLVNRYFKDTSYQTVLNGRPLLYIFGFGEVTGVAEEILTLRAAAKAAVQPDPYVVFMGDAGTARRLGADAVSSYVTSGVDGEPYTSLTAREERSWNVARASGMPVVPWVTTGWDPRPRIVHPTPWVVYQPNSWAHTASAREIAEHTRDAVRWTRANSAAAPANALIVYAWNENDEGGWLCPTLRNGTDRIDALHDVLVPRAAKPNP